MKFTNKTYDLLKWLCIIAFPALATFYAVVAKIWGLPFETQIPSTITAIATFIGALVGVSRLNYRGEVLVLPMMRWCLMPAHSH